MKKIIALLLLCCSAAFAQTTTFTANLKDLLGNTPVSPESAQVYIELSLRNIGSATPPTLCRVNGVGVVTFPVNIYPVSGVASGTTYDETFITCAGTTGASYYHVRVMQGDSTRTLIKKILFEDDYDIEGASFNLNSTAPRSAGVITPPPATAVLTNPSGNQTIVQPGGTALSVNRLSAGFAQSANGTDMIPGNRFTDTSPTGNFFNFKNAALSTSLWQVDVTGTLLAGIIPNARLSTLPDTGTGTTNKLPKYTTGASGIIGDSSITDNGTLISATEPITTTGATSGLPTAGGAAPYLYSQNSSPHGGSMLIGDGSGWQFDFAKRTGSITTNLVSITDAGAVLLAKTDGTLPASVANDTAGGLSLRNNSGKGIQISSGANIFLNQPGAFLSFPGATSGTTNLIASSTAGATTATLPANTGTVAETNLAQTWSANQTHNSGTLLLAGSSSGTTTLNASATASGTITVPAATDTLVGRATTDTLTNKTLGAPSITGLAPYKRLAGTNGTAVVAGDLVLSAGWGSTVTKNFVLGSDGFGAIGITPGGTGIAANPTITFTFHDGAWNNPPICQPVRRDGQSPQVFWAETSNTTTVITWTFPSTPVSGNQYTLVWSCQDR